MTEVEQARQTLAEEQAKNLEAQSNLGRQRALYANPNALRKAGLGYLLSPAYKMQKAEALSRFNTAQEQINQRQADLEQFESSINTYEQDLENARKAQEQQNSLEYLKKIANSTKGYSSKQLKNLGFNKEDIGIIKDIQENNLASERFVSRFREISKQGLKPVVQGGKIVGFLDERAGQSISIESVPSIVRENPIQAQRFEKAGIISSQTTNNFQTLANTNSGVNLVPKIRITDVPAQVLTSSLHFKNREVEAVANPENPIYYDPKKGTAEWESRIDSANQVSVNSSIKEGPKQIPILAKIRSGVGNVAEKIVSKVPLFTFSIPGTGVMGGGRAPQEFVDVQVGFVEGFVPTTKTELFTTAASFGVGTVIGAGLRTGGAVLRGTVPKLAPYIERGALVGGTGLFAVSSTKELANLRQLDSSLDVGRELGAISRDLTSLGYGTTIGSKISGRGVGYLRTIGLKEVPQRSVIEAGFYQGQTFPEIAPGTTPKLLKREFAEPKLPGEIPGASRGFSARIQPLAGITETGQARPGELVGTYIAPGISPKFFRASGESSKIFSFSEFGSIPTAERITFSEVLYAPKVKPGQKGLRTRFSPEEAQEISNLIKGTGKAVIPFIKLEKEAVLAAETPLRITARRFFLKDPISGQRVPIIEREVVPTAEFKGFKETRGTKPAREVFSTSSESGSRLSPSSSLNSLVSKYSKLSDRSIASSFAGRSTGSRLTNSSINRLTSESSFAELPTQSRFGSLSGLSSLGSRGSEPSIPRDPSIPGLTSRPRIPGNRFTQTKSGNRRRRKVNISSPAYVLFIKRRGKFISIASGLSRGRALQLGSDKIQRELARQFKIVQSGTTTGDDISFRPNENIFRDYRVVRGRRVALNKDQYIQKTSSLLKTREEKELIRQARIFRNI